KDIFGMSEPNRDKAQQGENK
ncbi:DUF3165 domain-containing protein, partial [Pseudomonas aeruginosa]